ncbi:MAG: CHAT domain-containing tetratricopeptide repeat protein [Chthonomonadales bacterium]
MQLKFRFKGNQLLSNGVKLRGWICILAAVITANISAARQASPQDVAQQFVQFLLKSDRHGANAFADPTPDTDRTITKTLDQIAPFKIPADAKLVIYPEEPQGGKCYSLAVAKWSATVGGKTGTLTFGLDIDLISRDGKWLVESCRPVLADLTDRLQNAVSTAELANLVKRYGPVISRRQVDELLARADDFRKAAQWTQAFNAVNAAIATIDALKSKLSEQAFSAILAPAQIMQGKIYSASGDPLNAFKSFKSAITTYYSVKDRKGLVEGSIAYSRLMLSIGMTENAEEVMQALVKVCEPLKDDRLMAETLALLGDIQSAQGKYQDASTNLDQALTVATLSKDGTVLAEVNLVRGTYFTAVKQFAEAFSELESARKGFAIATREVGEMKTNLAFGMLYYETGKYTDSFQFLDRSLSTARRLNDKPVMMEALMSLDLLYLETGEFLKSSEAGLEANKLAGECKNYLKAVDSWKSIIRASVEVGNLEGAASGAEEWLSISRLINNPRRTLDALMAKGEIALLQKNPAKAEAAYSEAKAIADKVGDPERQASVVTGLGDLKAFKNDWPGALKLYSQATGLMDSIRGQALVSSLKSSLMEKLSRPYEREMLACLKLGKIDLAFAAAERTKARELIDVMRAGKNTISKAMSPEQKVVEATLESKIDELSRRAETTVQTDKLEALIEQKNLQRRELESFRVNLYLKKPELKIQRGEFAPVTMQDIDREVLKPNPGTAVLLYQRIGSEKYLLVVDEAVSGKVRVTPIRIPFNDFAFRTASDELWRRCSSSDGKYHAFGGALYNILIKPAQALLKGKSQLIIIPDRDQLSIPFAVLEDANNKPLIATYAISYAPSASALVYMVRSQRAHKTMRPALDLLALGDAIFPKDYSPLPATRSEVMGISKLFAGKKLILTDKGATETALIKDMQSARYIHLATHGALNASAPMYSALVLTADKERTGMFEARTLADQSINADLMVLSACETALGQKTRGEGVVGLTWAAFVAGASGTVASQWQVSDVSTSMFMTNFYREALKSTPGMNKAKALRTAALQLMANKKYSHAYYWAPFVLNGAF